MKVKSLCTCVVVGMLSLSLTYSAGAVSLQNEQLINPSMTRSDNAILSDIINSLDPDDRGNVTYIDETGKVLVNKESLRQEVIPLEPVSLVTYKNSDSSLTSITDITYKDNMSLTSVTDTTYKSNRYKDSTGDLYTLPVLQPKPACMGNHSVTPMDFSTNSASFPECRDHRNGPYRSVWSHIGFAWASTVVHLPTAREIRDNNSGYNGSTGFIYMGGWSNTNMAVDVGLQHSTKYNDWAPFMLIEGEKNPYTFKPRFDPDQEVRMKFYVPSDGNIALTLTGYADGEKITRTYVESAPGWTATGNGNLIKRTTSIGQIQDRQDYNDGSYIRRVRWSTSYIGTNSEDNIPWRNSQTYDYCSMPRSKVVVDYVHGGEETDNIFLD